MKRILLSLFGLAALAGLSGCSDGITAQESLKRIAEDPTIVLVDVRSSEEFTAGHLKDAKLVPLDQIEARMAEIPKDRQVLLYCRSGRRSGVALAKLKSSGYRMITHMQGGINAWKALGGQVVQ